MNEAEASHDTAFPWLPAEIACLTDPEWTYRDDLAPPALMMLTLRMLANGFTPDDKPPPEWLAGIHPDGLNSPVRRFARQCFGLNDIWNDARQSYDWFAPDPKTPGGPSVPVSPEEALQRCWTGHAQLVANDLFEHHETAAQALIRIPQQWRLWTLARAAKFMAHWQEAAAWPPALALAWIMFVGDWDRMAAFLENGSCMPTDGILLNCIGSALEDDDGTAKLDAADSFFRAVRSRSDSTGHVVVRGRLNGSGPMIELPPSDLASLEWAASPPHLHGAVLERSAGESYTNVLVDAASLLSAFPAIGAPPKTVVGELRATKSLEAAVKSHHASGAALPVYAHWRDPAQSEFRISGRGAKRAWDAAAKTFPELASPKGKAKRPRAG